MIYLKIYWIHKEKNLPYILYLELDENRYEMRKVYIYKDLKMQYASQFKLSTSSIFLSDKPIPKIDIIEKSGDDNNIFKAFVIEKNQFEEVWNKTIRKLKRILE